MNVDSTLIGVSKIFLDTAPVVYFVEKHPIYSLLVSAFVQKVDAGHITAFISPITLAECLVLPYRNNQLKLIKDFKALLLQTAYTQFVQLNSLIAEEAAQLRAKYYLKLADSLQIATAIHSSCELFLTNDKALKRVVDIPICIIDELLEKS